MTSQSQQPIAIPASELELNRLLEADPHALLLNIRKADYRLQAGDDDLACYFYRRALQAAGDRALPQLEYYDPGQFDWAPAIEAATATICEELIGLLARGAEEFRPFPENADGMPMGVSKALIDKKDWGVLPFCEQGWLYPDTIKSCPLTWETILQHAPLPRVAGWGPSVIFSMLKAGAHIGAHTGMHNTRLICHLPL